MSGRCIFFRRKGTTNTGERDCGVLSGEGFGWGRSRPVLFIRSEYIGVGGFLAGSSCDFVTGSYGGSGIHQFARCGVFDGTRRYGDYLRNRPQSDSEPCQPAGRKGDRQFATKNLGFVGKTTGDRRSFCMSFQGTVVFFHPGVLCALLAFGGR